MLFRVPEMDSAQSTARYAPSAAEVHEFARFLGISPVKDAKYLWIAEEALVAPLPAVWSERVGAAATRKPCRRRVSLTPSSPPQARQ